MCRPEITLHYLTLKELRNYIAYLKPSFSIQETEIIANYLLQLNESKNY